MGVCTERPNVPLDIIGRKPGHPLIHSSSRPSAQPRQASTLQPRSPYTVIGPSGKRTRAKRGGPRDKLNNAPAVNIEPVTPLDVPANRRTRKPLADKQRSVEREVRALLNKLTMAGLDSTSDRIIEWANKSEAEKDGRMVIHIIRLVFESVTKTPWSGVYALLCRKVMENISPNVQDDDVRGADGKPITGGRLFQKYMLNHCQEALERGWTAKVSGGTAATNAAKTSGEVELYSDEYDAIQKARRRGLGLVQFISELYKLQMLTERTMHECIEKLLAGIDNPGEEEIENSCRMLTATGKLLDNPKARAHMDVYFVRMEKLRKNNNVAPRMQFLLQVGFAARV